MKAKVWRRIVITGMIVLVLILAAGMLIGDYFYNLALNPQLDKTEILSAPHNQIKIENYDIEFDRDNDWQNTVDIQNVEMVSHDGLKLHAYKIENKASIRKWALICHGYIGRAEDMTRAARKFYEMGFSILLPDARGHGQSEGDYIGMGWHDRLDLVNWAEKVEREYQCDTMVLFGVSMGGATVMMASGEKLPSCVKAIVEDCGYSSVQEEFAYQMKQLYGLSPFPLLDFSSFVTKLRAGYTFKEANALEQVKKSVTPMLFIHGSLDTFVPPDMLDEVYDAANTEKEKMLVEGAGHGVSALVDEKAYWDKVAAFVGRYT